MFTRANKLPAHDRAIGAKPPPQRRQTPDQMNAMGMALAAAWGASSETLATMAGD